MKNLTEFIKESLNINENNSIKFSNINVNDYLDICVLYSDDYDYDPDSDESKEIIKWFNKYTKGKKLAIFCTEDNFVNATSEEGYKNFFKNFEKDVNIISDIEYNKMVDDANLKTLTSEYSDYYILGSKNGIEYNCADLPTFFISVI